MRALDLFGLEIELPSVSHPPSAKRLDAARKAQAARRLKAQQYSNNLDLFEDLLEFLRAPLFNRSALPADYRSDRALVEFVPDDEIGAASIDQADLTEIPYVGWGVPVVTDRHGLSWSHDGLIALQCNLFWESMEEMTLSNNEQEKWSVLKWVFQPAWVKRYVWDVRQGGSHCLATHERDHPFSFSNCAMASRIDADIIRDGFRRNLPGAVLDAVTRLVTY